MVIKGIRQFDMKYSVEYYQLHGYYNIDIVC